MTDPHSTTSRAEAEAVAAAGHPPTAQRASAAWTLLLTGPIAWFAHFGVVYLLAEAACRFAWLDGEWLGLRTLSISVLALTALFIVPVLITTVISWQSWRRSAAGASAASGEQRQSADDGPGRGGDPDDAARYGDRSLAFVSLVLGLLFIASILAVGLPALVLEPC